MRKYGSLATVVAALGLFLASRTVSDYSSWWYRALRRPAWLTFERVIPGVWMLVYLCSTASALLTERAVRRPGERQVIFGLYGLNAATHLLYGALFTRWHRLREATVDSGLIAASIGAVAVLQWRHSPLAALLNVPYFLWTSFATFLTWTLHDLNRLLEAVPAGKRGAMRQAQER